MSSKEAPPPPPPSAAHVEGSDDAAAAAAVAASATLESFCLAPEDNPDREVVEWMGEQSAKELQRVTALGVRVIPLRVRNMALVRQEDGKCINRLECATGFDFNKIAQIRISDPTPCPLKQGYAFINLVLFTRQPVPMLLPYLYDTSVEGNDLTEWVFINSKLQRAHHRVGHFSAIQ